MTYLNWCSHFLSLRRTLEDSFASMGYHPFFSASTQPTVGFDPSNLIYHVTPSSREPIPHQVRDGLAALKVKLVRTAACKHKENDQHPLFLRSSPERHMKMALVQNPVSLYEIGKVFRAGSDNATGPIHQNEFWMCEFYKVQSSLEGLMADTEMLLQKCAQALGSTQLFTHVRKITFDELFEAATACPLTPWLKERSPHQALDDLDFLYADRLQPTLARTPGLTFITHFPAPLCALAKVSPQTEHAPFEAQRFLRVEGVYCSDLHACVELFNGYEEIENFETLKLRLNTTLAYQKHQAMNRGPLCDPQYERILKKGLPKSAGCALGLDRLLMILLGHNRIFSHWPEASIPTTCEILP